MKSSLLASFVGCVFASCQTLKPIPIENGKLAGVLPLRDNVVYYETVEDMPGASAETIYQQARRWMAYNTADPKAPFHSPDNLSRMLLAQAISSRLSRVLSVKISYYFNPINRLHGVYRV